MREKTGQKRTGIQMLVLVEGPGGGKVIKGFCSGKTVDFADIQTMETYGKRACLLISKGNPGRGIFRLLASVGLAFLALAARAEDNTTNNVTSGSSTNANSFYVGRTGTNNTLHIYNQGSVTDKRGYIGYADTADGNTAFVSGTGSLWSSSRDFFVGFRGSENRLVVGNGGRVENKNGYVGRYAGSDSNRVSVAGNGSVWTNRADLFVGNGGSGNSLAIRVGGKVFSNKGEVGSLEGSSNNVVEIRSAGSAWTLADTLTVGGRGASNLVLVASNATLQVQGQVVLGNRASASGNQLIVKNASFSSGDDLLVGKSGSNSLFQASNGAVVENGADVMVGDQAGNNRVIVRGAATQWSVAGRLVSGNAAGTNWIKIANGATVSSGSAQVGRLEGAVGNEIVVTGSGTTWTNLGALYVGSAGDRNQLSVKNGAQVGVGDDTVVGKTSDDNELTVDAATLVAQRLVVGRDGGGNSLSIKNGAVVENGGDAIVGNQANNNRAVAQGAGTQWSVAGQLVSGDQGSDNQIEMVDGATVSSESARIGHRDGADGNKISVEGSGTTWTNLGTLYVGNAGKRNQLAVKNGAQVGVGDDTVVGKTSDDNELSLDNAALVAHRLDVGRDGSGNRLLLENGADAFLDGNLFVGRNAGSSNNLASVLSNSRLLADELYVGYDGSDNELQVLSGGKVETVNVHIGHRADANGNIVEIGGAGSVWSNEAAFYIGGDVSSTGNLVRISDGGGLFSRLLSIRSGSSLKMDGGSISISSGGGGNLAGGGTFILGDQFGGSTLQVRNGGRVASGRTVFGNNAGADGNSATVEGAGSDWKAEYFVMGRAASSNRVSVLNGGKIESARTIVGKLAGSTDNQVLVSGEGSEWTTTGKLVVGFNEEAGNLWSVEDQALSSHFAARVANHAVLHLENATFQTQEGLRISNGGTLSGWGWVDGSVTNLGLLDPGDSTQAGTLEFNDSLILLGSSEIQLTLWSTSSYDRIVVDGDFAFDGSLSVVFGGGYTPQAGDTFDLFDWGASSSGTFGASALAAPSGSLHWDTSDLYTTGTIRAVPEPAATAFILFAAAGLLAANRIFRLRERGGWRSPGKIR